MQEIGTEWGRKRAENDVVEAIVTESIELLLVLKEEWEFEMRNRMNRTRSVRCVGNQKRKRKRREME